MKKALQIIGAVVVVLAIVAVVGVTALYQSFCTGGGHGFC